MRKVVMFMLLLLALPQLMIGQASQSIIRWVESGGTIRTVGETAATALPVNIVAGSTAGTQYTEGDTDATITGTAAMMEVAANVLQPVQGTVADGLLVNLGANNDVTVTGTVTVDSELAAAAALTDNFANPTIPGVGAFAMFWDGATWDRAPGNSADGLLVNLGSNNDVTITSGTVGHSSTGMAHGVKTIAAAGTDEAIAGSTAAKHIIIQAQTDNTGWCAVGGTGVDATIATGTGVLLGPGDSAPFNIDNLADVFVDCTVTGDGVRFTYET